MYISLSERAQEAQAKAKRNGASVKTLRRQAKRNFDVDAKSEPKKKKGSSSVFGSYRW